MYVLLPIDDVTAGVPGGHGNASAWRTCTKLDVRLLFVKQTLLASALSSVHLLTSSSSNGTSSNGTSSGGGGSRSSSSSKGGDSSSSSSSSKSPE